MLETMELAPATHYDQPPEEPEVQVRTDSSAWHRHALDGVHTACGQDLRQYRFRGGSLRYETYEGELCKCGCFSPFELQLADEHNRERAEGRR